MPAISRTWRSTHSMPAAWSPRRRAGAPARDRRLEGLRPLRIIFPPGKLQRVHTFSSRRFRRWPCLIRNDRAAVEVAARGAAVEEVAAEVRAAAAKVAREEAQAAAKVAREEAQAAEEEAALVVAPVA